MRRELDQTHCYKSRGWWLQSQYKGKTCRSKGAHLKFAIHKESVEFFLCICRALICPNLIVFVNCTFRILESPVQPVLGLPKSGKYFFFNFNFLKFFFSLFIFSFYLFQFLFIYLSFISIHFYFFSIPLPRIIGNWSLGLLVPFHPYKSIRINKTHSIWCVWNNQNIFFFIKFSKIIIWD